MKLLLAAAMLAPALLNAALLTHQSPRSASIGYLAPAGELTDSVEAPIYKVEGPLYQKANIGVVSSSVYQTAGGYDFYYEIALDPEAYAIRKFTLLFFSDASIDGVEVGVLAPEPVLFAASAADDSAGPSVPTAAEWFSWSSGRIVNIYFDDPVMPGSRSATLVLRTDAAYYALMQPGSLETVVLADGHPYGLLTDGALFAAIEAPEPGTFWAMAAAGLLWAALRKPRPAKRAPEQ